MSKATSNLSRRTVIASAIAAPAFAVPNIVLPTAAAASSPDAGLFFILEEKFAAACAHSEIVSERWNAADDAMNEWKRLNPEPAFPTSRDPAAENLMVQVFQVVENGGREEFLAQEPLTALTAEAQASFREMSAVLQLHISWRAAKRAANLRYEEIEAEWHASVDAIADLLEEAADLKATTLDGLRCKARLYELEPDMASDRGLADAIVSDLLAMQKPRALIASGLLERKL